MTKKIFDVIIIGGGPAGYTSALYTSRAGLETLVIEKLGPGGQMAQTTQIDNYPGVEKGIDGFSLALKMQEGAEFFGAKTLVSEVISVDLKGDIKTITTKKEQLYSKTVIIAIGAEPKKIGIERENELQGKGIGYCASCDGMFYKDKVVTVIGGGNSAVANALYLSNICKKVMLIHRGENLSSTKIYNIPLQKTDNIEIIKNSALEEILGNNKVSGIRIKNLKDNTLSTIDCEGIFISIGRSPQTNIFKNQIALDDSGYIIADETTQTSISGVFAAGDVRTKPFRQITTATSDGTTAAHFAEKYLTKNK